MNDEAFGAQLVASLPTLRRRAAFVLKGFGDPENLANEAIANAWKAYAAGRYQEQGELSHYLYRIVSRLAIDCIRAERPGRVCSLDEGLQSYSDRWASKQDVEAEAGDRDLLRSVVANMLPRSRYVVVQLLSGQKQHEVGRRLGLSGKSVAAIVHRSRQRARRHAGMPPLGGLRHASPLVA